MKNLLKKIGLGVLALFALLLVLAILLPEEPGAREAREARRASDAAARDSIRAERSAERAAERAERDSLRSAAQEARERSRHLDAVVRLTNTQMHVTNTAGFDWTDCKIEINRRWNVNASRIISGSTVTAGLMTFTASSGERFNPSTHAIQQISIFCNTPNGLASYFGRAS